MKNESEYYVMCMNGGGSHSTFNHLYKAQIEAKRKAEQHKGCMFSVVRLVQTVQYREYPFITVNYSKEVLPLPGTPEE